MKQFLLVMLLILVPQIVRAYDIQHDSYSLNRSVNILVFKKDVDFKKMLEKLNIPQDVLIFLTDTAKTVPSKGGLVAKVIKPALSIVNAIAKIVNDAATDKIIKSYTVGYYKDAARGSSFNKEIKNHPADEPGFWVVFMEPKTNQVLLQQRMPPNAFMSFRTEKDTEGDIISRISFNAMKTPEETQAEEHTFDETKQLLQNAKANSFPSITVPTWTGNIVDQITSGQSSASMAIKGWALIFEQKQHTIINNTNRAFNVKLVTTGLCVDNIETAVQAKNEYDITYPTVVYSASSCPIKEVILYDIRHDHNGDYKITPPGKVTFSAQSSPTLITIDEYKKSPGKYFITVVSQKDQKVIRDSRVKSEKEKQQLSPDSPEATTYRK